MTKLMLLTGLAAVLASPALATDPRRADAPRPGCTVRQPNVPAGKIVHAAPPRAVCSEDPRSADRTSPPAGSGAQAPAR